MVISPGFPSLEILTATASVTATIECHQYLNCLESSKWGVLTFSIRVPLKYEHSASLCLSVLSSSPSSHLRAGLKIETQTGTVEIKEVGKGAESGKSLKEEKQLEQDSQFI